MQCELASCLLEMVVCTDDLGKACLVCCQDGLAEPLDSVVLKLLKVLHRVTVKAFIDRDVSVIF